MIAEKEIKRVALILFDYSLNRNKMPIINDSNELIIIINKNLSSFPLDKNVLYREISNYLIHVTNKGNKHLKEIQIYLALVALQKLIEDERGKDDLNASKKR